MNLVEMLAFLSEFFRSVDHVVLGTAPFLVAAYLVFGLDDFFIDAMAWGFSLRPRKLSAARFRILQKMPEKRIAVMIASWKEAGVLTKMVRGNVRNIQYRNYDFFLGVYPNDDKTLAEAQELAAQYPNVHCVVNTKDGPTSKGQMINELARAILASEKPGDQPYDCVMIHDSEDLIHRHAFQIINWKLNAYDFIQVPIFSLPTPLKELVAGTYIDEFSESHTKDILVRKKMGVSIPSAGVGTAMSRKLVQTYMRVQDGNLLNQKSLTEDYELGVSTTRYGLKSTFAAYFLEKEVAGGRKREYIATREYFPKAFYRSIKQKTRWTFGIAFQGTEHLGWSGSWAHKYFLFRDRKGPVANLLVLFGTTLFIYACLRVGFDDQAFASFEAGSYGALETQLLSVGFAANAFFMINRIFQRFYCVWAVYGLQMALLAPVRLPIANVINAAASLRAMKQYADHKISGLAPQWSKTEHELPEDFGEIPDGDIVGVGADAAVAISAPVAAVDVAGLTAAPKLPVPPAPARDRVAARRPVEPPARLPGQQASRSGESTHDHRA